MGACQDLCSRRPLCARGCFTAQTAPDSSEQCPLTRTVSSPSSVLRAPRRERGREEHHVQDAERGRGPERRARRGQDARGVRALTLSCREPDAGPGTRSAPRCPHALLERGPPRSHGTQDSARRRRRRRRGERGPGRGAGGGVFARCLGRKWVWGDWPFCLPWPIQPQSPGTGGLHTSERDLPPECLLASPHVLPRRPCASP